MSEKDKKSVNIPIGSSVANLREELEAIGKRRGIHLSKVVSQIYIFAVSNTEAFPRELESRYPNPGKHISTTVSANVAVSLSEWAKDLGRTRVAHCCFLLEAVTKDKALEKKIFK